MYRVSTWVPALLALAFSGLAVAQEMQPGMYAITGTIEPKAGQPRSFQEKECITAKDIAEGLTKVGIESDTECKVQNLVKAGGKISYRLICEDDGKKVPSEVTGTYAPDAYDFTIKPAAKEVPYKSVRVKGKRIGACK